MEGGREGRKEGGREEKNASRRVKGYGRISDIFFRDKTA